MDVEYLGEWNMGVFVASASFVTFSTALAAPVETIITGRFAFFHRPSAFSMASGCGAGFNDKPERSPPDEMLSTGVDSTSIGMSTKTGPGAPDVVARHARLTIRGISLTSVI